MINTLGSGGLLMWVIVPRIIGTDVDSDTFGHPGV